MVGSSYTVREVYAGQSLASPGRWAVEDRRYLEDPVWKAGPAAEWLITFRLKVSRWSATQRIVQMSR